MKKSVLRCLSATIVYVFSATITIAYSANQIAIIDAGSGGSRLYVYTVTPTPSPSGVPLVVEDPVFTKRVTPGLATLALNLNQAAVNNYMAPLWNQLLTNHYQGPVFLMATAGMRLLPLVTQQAIYALVRESAVEFSIPNFSAQTISGIVEGQYGWTTVNYLEKTFQESKPTIGALDLGGASTQITYEMTSGLAPTQPIKVGNKTYSVYSNSFLGFGQTEMRQNVAGYNHLNFAACYPKGYVPLFPYTPVGNFDFTTCKQLTANYMIMNANELQVPTDVAQHDFIAFSGYYFSASFFFGNPPGTISASRYQSQINAICYQSWAEFKQAYPTVPEQFLSAECLNGVYIYNLLSRLYGNVGDVGGTVTALDEIDGQDLTWTLGAALLNS